MKIIFTVTLAYLLAGFPVQSANDKTHDLTLAGIEHAYNMQFELADEIFKQIIRLDPNDARGYLLRMVIAYYQYQFGEKREYFEKQFKELNSKASKLARRRMSDKTYRTDALFHLGTANMYMAAYHGDRGNWLRAYWFGKDGIDYLMKLVQLEPTYYDAYLGLGLYHYYTDVIPKFAKVVTFLMGIKSDRHKGLAELELASKKSKYSRAESLMFLGNIHLYTERNYEKALPYFETLRGLYPESPGFGILLGEAQQRLGKHTEALATYEQVVAAESTRRFPMLLSNVHFLLGNVSAESNEYDQAIGHYRKAIEVAAQSSGNVKWIDAWAMYGIGDCYEMLDNRELAVTAYDQVKKSGSKRAHELAKERLKTPLLAADIKLRTGHNFYKTRGYYQAIAVYEEVWYRCRKNSKEYPRAKITEIEYHIAKSHYRNKSYDIAVPKFHAILALNKIKEDWIKPWSHYQLGNCYAEMGERAKAKVEYDAAYDFKDTRLRFEIEKKREALTDQGK